MIINAKGLACPEPVILAKKELEKIEEGIITVLVDNKASCSNVKNFAVSKGCTVNVSEEAGVYSLEIVKGYTCDVPAKQSESNDSFLNIVVHLSGECMGYEDPVLGKKLMKGFLGNLKNMETTPKTVIFVNTSVKYVTEDEDTIAIMKELEETGVEILACGACLEHFLLIDNLKVGSVSDAHKVMTRMFEADKLIRL